MSAPLEFIIGITAATLIGVGSVIVVLDTNARKHEPETEQKVECVYQGEKVRCTPRILEETKEETSVVGLITTKPVVEMRIERVEDALEKIAKRLDQIEKKVGEEKRR